MDGGGWWVVDGVQRVVAGVGDRSRPSALCRLECERWQLGWVREQASRVSEVALATNA